MNSFSTHCSNEQLKIKIKKIVPLMILIKTIIKYFITMQQKKHEVFYTQSQETVLRDIRK